MHLRTDQVTELDNISQYNVVRNRIVTDVLRTNIMLSIYKHCVLVSRAVFQNIRNFFLRLGRIDKFLRIDIYKAQAGDRVFLVQCRFTELHSVLVVHANRQELPDKDVSAYLQTATPYDVQRLAEHAVLACSSKSFGNIDKLLELWTTVLDRKAGRLVVNENLDGQPIVVPRQERTFSTTRTHQFLVVLGTHRLDQLDHGCTIGITQNTHQDSNCVIDAHACSHIANTLGAVLEYHPARNLRVRIRWHFSSFAGILVLVERTIVHERPATEFRVIRNVRHVVFKTNLCTIVRLFRLFKRHIDTNHIYSLPQTSQRFS